jgi:hypothetical protein
MNNRLLLHCELDHLVITAPTLEAGSKYIQQALGVMPQPGGRHARMSTHNCLVKLGKMTYLEAIAADPDAPRPERARWFELDVLEESSPARLATWVMRVNDIEAALAASPIPLGRIEALSRGHLNWRITIPEDGSLPLQGIVPTLIQWEPGPHPASRLEDSGCSLIRLDGFHPQAQKIADMLKAIGFNGDFRINALPEHKKPYLVASIQTPWGMRKLGEIDYLI